MKQGWEIKKLGELCEVLDNKRKPITKKDRIDGEYPYYGATGILSYVHNFIFDEKLVLIGEDGAKWTSGDNTSFIAEGKYWVNNHAHVIRPNRKIISDEWIVYFLNFTDLTEYITGMTVPKLNQEKMRGIEIPLPALPEQKRILAILDEISSDIGKAKENAEQNLKNAKELFESYLQRVFENKGDGWEEKTIDEIIESNIIGLTKNSAEQRLDYEYKYVKMNNITRDNRFDLTKYTCVNATKLEAEKYSLSKGDFLFNTRNSYELVGKTCLFEGFEDEVILYNNNIMRIRFIKTINPQFINYSFTTQEIIKKLDRLKSGTTNVSAIYYKDLKNLKLLIPPINQQNLIVKKLDALSAETKKLEAIYQQKINNLEEFKKSVLQKAFNGELKTNNHRKSNMQKMPIEN